MLCSLRGFAGNLVADIDEILQRFLALRKLGKKVASDPAVTDNGCSVFEPANAKHRIRQVRILRFFPEEQKRRVGQLIAGHEPKSREYCCDWFAFIGTGEPPGAFCQTYKNPDCLFINVRKAVLRG